jgi:transposase-like protein
MTIEDIIIQLEGRTDEETQSRCVSALETYFWGGVPMCPRCKNRSKVTRLKILRGRRVPLYQCNKCRKQFNVFNAPKASVFSHNKLDLILWFKAISYISERIPVSEWCRELSLPKRDARKLAEKVRKLGKAVERNHLMRAGRKWIEKTQPLTSFPLE